MLFYIIKEVKVVLSVTRDNHIKITRGDSAILQLAWEDEHGVPYLPTEADGLGVYIGIT